MPFSLKSYFREKFGVVVREREDMHLYQSGEAVPFLLKNPFSALFVDLGLGKTVSTATVIADLFDAMDFGFSRCLIIAPPRVARQTWPAEFAIWRHLAHLTYSNPLDLQYRKELSAAVRAAMQFERSLIEIDEPEHESDDAKAIFWELQNIALRKVAKMARLKQSKISIIAALKRHPESIHIISRDAVAHLVDALTPARWIYDTVILDESHAFKNHKALRFKAIKRVRPRIKRMHLLTATPAPETYLDLFAQIWLLDQGKRLGSNITAYRERYFDKSYNGWDWNIKPGAAEAIAKRIVDICLTMKAEDYLKIDKPIHIEVPVILDAAEMRAYKKFEYTLMYSVDDLQVIEAKTAASLSQKLLQLASGFIYDEAKTPHFVHDGKIETLLEVVEEAHDEPVLVVYWFKSSLARLKKVFPKAVVMDDAGTCVDAWNRGEIPVLLFQPAGASEGLNLQDGGHIIVFFDLFWPLLPYLQTIGRLARQGQKHVVRVIHLVAKGTIDENVMAAWRSKESGQSVMFATLKRLRKLLDAARARKTPEPVIEEEEFDEAL